MLAPQDVNVGGPNDRMFLLLLVMSQSLLTEGIPQWPLPRTVGRHTW